MIYEPPIHKGHSRYLIPAKPGFELCADGCENYICTRPMNHKGDHAAHGGYTKYAPMYARSKQESESVK